MRSALLHLCTIVTELYLYGIEAGDENANTELIPRYITAIIVRIESVDMRKT